MNLARRLTEARPSVRWHVANVVSRTLYRRAFGSFGEGSVISAPRVLRGTDRIFIGSHVEVRGQAWLACEEGGGPIVIGDGTTLGDLVHVHALDRVEIGSGTLVGESTLITTANHASEGDRADVEPMGAITIGDGVFIGQGCVIFGGVTIGDGATIGAGSVVLRDVPAGASAMGVPARVVRAPGSGQATTPSDGS
jgi:acetyltransferase-like isoleucine patch superfamily enzyme